MRFYVGHTALLPLRQCPYNTIQYNELMLIIAPSYSTLDSALPSTPNIGGGGPLPQYQCPCLSCCCVTTELPRLRIMLTRTLKHYSLTHSLTHSLYATYCKLQENIVCWKNSPAFLFCYAPPIIRDRQTDVRQKHRFMPPPYRGRRHNNEYCTVLKGLRAYFADVFYF